MCLVPALKLPDFRYHHYGWLVRIPGIKVCKLMLTISLTHPYLYPQLSAMADEVTVHTQITFYHRHPHQQIEPKHYLRGISLRIKLTHPLSPSSQ
jgi:hypothetical protein